MISLLWSNYFIWFSWHLVSFLSTLYQRKMHYLNLYYIFRKVSLGSKSKTMQQIIFQVWIIWFILNTMFIFHMETNWLLFYKVVYFWKYVTMSSASRPQNPPINRIESNMFKTTSSLHKHLFFFIETPFCCDIYRRKNRLKISLTW
jgi:hypothetical protein